MGLVFLAYLLPLLNSSATVTIFPDDESSYPSTAKKGPIITRRQRFYLPCFANWRGNG
jgi:hypothetical protein